MEVKFKKKITFFHFATTSSSSPLSAYLAHQLRPHEYMFLFVLCLHILITSANGTPSTGMFSETLTTTFSSTLNNYTFLQTVTRLESSQTCSSSLYSLIVNNDNFTLNSFETKNKYFQCSEIFELFCNTAVASKTIISHSLMDCEDLLKASNATQTLTLANNVNANKLINLSPSSSQVVASLVTLMNAFSVKKYALVYSDTFSNYYSQMASIIVYKLSKVDSTFSLEFSKSLGDSSLSSSFNSSFNSTSIKRKFLFFLLLLRKAS